MARKDIRIPLDRENRNDVNHNFKELYDDFRDVVDLVTKEAYDQIIEGSRINWDKMVDSVGDLPSDAVEGDARGVKSDNKIYRFDGNEWVAIGELSLNPISEVDDRMTDTVLGINNNTITPIYDGDRLIRVEEKKDGDIVRQVELNYAGGLLTRVTETIDEDTVESLLNYSNNKLTSIEKEIL